MLGEGDLIEPVPIQGMSNKNASACHREDFACCITVAVTSTTIKKSITGSFPMFCDIQLLLYISCRAAPKFSFCVYWQGTANSHRMTEAALKFSSNFNY